MKKFLFAVLFIMALTSGFGMDYQGTYRSLVLPGQTISIVDNMFINNVNGFRTTISYMYNSEEMLMVKMDFGAANIAFVEGEAGDITLIVFGLDMKGDVLLFKKDAPLSDLVSTYENEGGKE